jgi:uncharacterized membrane protein YphA (DoxX/SURF4 family)
MTAQMTSLTSPGAPTRSRTITYWAATFVLGMEGIVGGVLALIRWSPYAGIMQHLGYPAYLMTIVGVAYMVAGVIVLAPRLPRLKEWAYAGLFINYAGAAASHLTVGDGAGALVGPLMFTSFLVASWVLRPPPRRLAGPQL